MQVLVGHFGFKSVVYPCLLFNFPGYCHYVMSDPIPTRDKPDGSNGSLSTNFGYPKPKWCGFNGIRHAYMHNKDSNVQL